MSSVGFQSVRDRSQENSSSAVENNESGQSTTLSPPSSPPKTSDDESHKHRPNNNKNDNNRNSPRRNKNSSSRLARNHNTVQSDSCRRHDDDNGNDDGDDEEEVDDNDYRDHELENIPSARFPAVLEPSGRSGLEQYSEQMRSKELYLSFVAKTQWPPWRRTLSRFVRFNRYFEWTVFLLIIVNALIIILDSFVQATNSPTDSLLTLDKLVTGLDNLVTWAFVLEMLLKWLAMGLWTNGSGYFANLGNCVDCCINIFSVYAVIQEIVNPVGLGAAASAVRSVRLLRTFRAVKALRNLSVLVDALFVAVARLADVGLMYLLFITFMCFVGLQLFRSRYGRNCVQVVNSADLITLLNETIPVGVVHTSFASWDNSTVYWRSTGQICELGMPQEIAEKIAGLPPGSNYSWLEPFSDVSSLFSGYVCPYGQFCKAGLETPERGLINFDSIFYAMTTLITVSVYENWCVIMYSAMFASGQMSSVFFLVVTLVGSIFTLNLILAILTDAFTQSLSILRKSLDEHAVPDDVVGAVSDGDGDGDDHSRNIGGGSHDQNSEEDATEETAEEIARSRYRRFDENNVWEAKEVAGDSFSALRNRDPDRRKRSYSVLKELRTRVHATPLALDNSSSSSSSHQIRMMSDSEIDSSLDWLRAEWAVVVLEARKREDLELTAAELLHEADFKDVKSACWLKLYGMYRRVQSWVLQNIVVARWFMGIGLALTFVNVVLLSVVYPKMPQPLKDGLTTTSIVFSALFAVESVLRVVGLGWKTFFRDPFNVVDGGLAVFSLIELAASGHTSIAAVRTIRLLRLLSYFPSVIAALRTLAVALKASASLMVQLSIMMFVFAVLGQQLFRGRLCGLDEDPAFLVSETKLCELPDKAPAFNFDNLASALIVVFIIVAGDGWRQYWVDCASRTSPYHSLYFIFVYIIGNYIFVNLFVAVLIDAANQSRAAAEGEQKSLQDEDYTNEGALREVTHEDEEEEDNNNRRRRHGNVGNDLDAPLNCEVVTPSLPPRSIVHRDDDDEGQEMIHRSGASAGRVVVAAVAATSTKNETMPSAAAASCAPRGRCYSGDDDDNDQDNDASKTTSRVGSFERYALAPLRFLYRLHSRYVPHHARVLCARFASNRYWKILLAATAVASSLSYFLWAKATDHPYSTASIALNYIELVAAVLSTIDSVSRFTALGRVCSPLTQIVNVVSYLVLILQWSDVPSRSWLVALFRVVTRAVRPWAFMMRFARFRLIFFSLTRAVSALRSVGAIALLIWFTYGVLGAQLFAGKLNACTEGRLESDWGDQTYGKHKIKNESACLAANYSWIAYKFNYDNVGSAMLCLVSAATTDDWTNIMYLTTGVSDEGSAPEPGLFLANALFMCTFCAILSFFLINVIVSVIVDAFFTTKKQMEESAQQVSDAKSRELALASIASDGTRTATSARIHLGCSGELDVLGDSQQDYFDLAHHALLLVKPTMPVSFGPGSCRWKIRHFIRSRYFNYVYLLIAVCDFVIQATAFAANPPISGWILVNLDFAFSAVLITFTLLRILGNSVRGFIQEFSNVFELVINLMIFSSNICSIVIFATRHNNQSLQEQEPQKDANGGGAFTTAFAQFQQLNGAGVAFGIIRNLRLLRFQRILNTIHGMRVIIFTIRNSANNFVAGISVVLLVYFVYACLGLVLFGRVLNNGTGLTSLNNFDSIPLGMSTLFRVATLDDWEAVMRSCGLHEFPCSDRLGNCGNIQISIIFFYSFMVLGQWVTMSSFVAILLNSFADADRSERFAVQRKDVDRFRKLWKIFADPRTQLLHVTKLPLMIQRLGPAFGVEDELYVATEAMESLKREEARKKKAANKIATTSSTSSAPPPLPLPTASDQQEQASPIFSALAAQQQQNDVDDSDAGNDFDHVALLQMAVNKNSLKTRFCSLKRAIQFVKELKMVTGGGSGADSSTGAVVGLVTLAQVFEACMKHHYGVPLPANYELELERSYERTFPLDVERLADAAVVAGNNSNRMNNIGITSNGNISPLSNNTQNNNNNNNNMGNAGQRDSPLMSPSFDPRSAHDYLQLIRLQSWWRAMKFRRIVLQAQSASATRSSQRRGDERETPTGVMSVKNEQSEL